MEVTDIEDLPAQIERAALDGDVSALLRLLEAKHEQGVIDWTRQCQNLRERIDELKQERERCQRESQHLEPVLKDAAQAYAKALDEADRRRFEMQKIQLRLGGLDSRLEVLREDINETSAELRQVVNARLNERL